MPPPGVPRVPFGPVVRLFICALLLSGWTARLPGAEPSPPKFDLPAGDAAEMLKRFGAQAQREILFPAAAVVDVRTNAVRGQYAVRVALDRMLANSGLSVAEDAKSGALIIFRATAPQAPGAATPERPKSQAPPKQETSKSMNRKTPLAVLSALFSIVTAPAQTAPATAGAKQDEPIRLSEFRVDTSKDRGYVATNATTGTRLNMSIKEIPLPIEVITREFIDDIGAVDIKEALEYSAGIVQDTVTTGNSFTFSPSGSGNAGSVSRDSVGITIRGLNTRSFLRSGFRQDTITDEINIDRLEVARGPQSLLYGIAALGGIVNISPRYPRSAPFQDVRIAFGSFDFARFEAYSTGRVLGAPGAKRYLNYGVGLVAQKQSRPDDLNDRTRLLVTPAFDFRVSEKTNVFLDMEYGRFRTEGNGFQDINDANAGNVRNEFGLRVAENVNIYNQTINVARDRFGRDRFFRLSSKDHYTEEDYFSGTIEVTQQLPANLKLIAAANYTDTLTKRRSSTAGVATANTASASILPTAAGTWTSIGPNPSVAGQNYWKTVSTGWSASPTHKYIKQTRVDLSYEFNVFGNKQTVLLGRTDQTVTQNTRNTTQASPVVYRAFGDLSPINYAGEIIRPVNDGYFAEWNTGHYGMLQSRWWRDRVVLIAGFRDDRYMVRDLQYDFAKADAAQPDTNVNNWVRSPSFNLSQANSAPGAVPKVNGYRFGGKVQHQDGPTVALSFAVTKDINLYAATATGVFPNTGQRDGNGDAFEAEISKSKEVGAKFDLWKDPRGRARISGTLTYYTQDRENAIYNLFWAPQGRSNNRQRARAGVTTGPVSGTGPGAYSVNNSGFQDFETSLPVTYLVPVGYVAAADLTSTRVTGAPQQGGFILVDYASLGTAATDPLRRALDAAASDTSNLTALQAGSVGTGATGLYANNGYAFNRNSDVSYNDESRGVEAQIYFNITDDLSSVLTYNHLVQGVTGGFTVPDQAKSTEYDSWWNYMGVPLATRRGNLVESAYDFSGQIKGARTSDNPRNKISLWNNWRLPADGIFKGFSLSLGVNWEGARQSEVTINNGARDLKLSENVRFKPQFPDHYTYNAAVGWNGKWLDRKWRVRLNVNNLLDDQKDAAYGSSTLFIDPATGATVASTTAGAQKITVPERVVRYFDPISFRLSIGTSF